ncbi:MAG: hypothetical protein KAG53_10040, partial [Endozoicomonadaceae bacterium]|nr:hypothetical protein [Endozoicomonadaceae bacterium]
MQTTNVITHVNRIPVNNEIIKKLEDPTGARKQNVFIGFTVGSSSYEFEGSSMILTGYNTALREKSLVAVARLFEKKGISIRSVAEAGFVYTGQHGSDKVTCVFCKGTLSQFDENDNPMKDHKLNFKQCPMMQGKVPSEFSILSHRSNNSPVDSLDSRPYQSTDSKPGISDSVKPTKESTGARCVESESEIVSESEYDASVKTFLREKRVMIIKSMEVCTASKYIDILYSGNSGIRFSNIGALISESTKCILMEKLKEGREIGVRELIGPCSRKASAGIVLIAMMAAEGILPLNKYPDWVAGFVRRLDPSIIESKP